MNPTTSKFIVICLSLSLAGLSVPARADTILTIDFSFTDAITLTSVDDVLNGNVVIDETTNQITAITSDFSPAVPDPSVTFSNLNGGNPLFQVGDSVSATAIPGTSQTITDSTSGVTLDWTSVTTVPQACSACTGGVYYIVAFNGSDPSSGGGPNTITIGGVVEANFDPGDFVLELPGVSSSTPPVSTPEPTSIALLAAGLLGLGGSRKARAKRGAARSQAEMTAATK